MTKNVAESTVPATVPETGIQTSNEKTREEERYLAPPVDIFETDEGLTVVADLPGVESKDLNVTVEKGILTIQGKTPAAGNGQDGSYLWREYRLAHFWRQFQLSDAVDQEKIKAEFKNGVLTLRLPKAEAVKPRAIQVKVA
jgi:HSP20 family molecular chaperone IbpA